jgi:hypothetical protein
MNIQHKLVVVDGMQTIHDCLTSKGIYQDWLKESPLPPDPMFAQSTSTIAVGSRTKDPNAPPRRTFGDLVNVFKTWIGKFIANKAKVVIITFDKCKYVPHEKGIIQKDRAEGTMDISKCPPVDSCLNLDSVIVKEHWDAYMHDRKVSREKISAAITKFLMSFRGELTHVPDLRVGTRLYIDGHCLSTQQLKEAGITRNLSYDMAYDRPLLLTKEREGFMLDLDDALSNKIGEAECALPFYLRTLPRSLIVDDTIACYPGCPSVATSNHEHEHGTITALMVTTDTDMMWITLTHMDKIHKDSDSRAKLPIIDVRRTAIYTSPEYMRVNYLYNEIQAWPQLSALKNKVASLMAAIYSAGCDYTISHYYVNHQRFIEALMEHADEIGDLVLTEDVNGTPFSNKVGISAQAYVNLLLWAYRTANKKRIKEDQQVDFNNINKYLDGSAIGKEPLDADRFFPCPDDIKYSLMQVWWYTIMIRSVGDPVLNIRDSSSYGYDKIDTGKPYEKGNIKWKLCTCVKDNAPPKPPKTPKKPRKKAAENATPGTAQNAKPRKRTTTAKKSQPVVKSNAPTVKL